MPDPSLQSQFSVLMADADTAKSNYDISTDVAARYVAHKPGGTVRAEVEAERDAATGELIKAYDRLYHFLRDNSIKFVEQTPEPTPPVRIGPTATKRKKAS